MSNNTNTEIHGLNAIAIAAIFEYVQNPGHPMHAQAKEMAAQFIETQRKERIKENQEMMQAQRADMTEEEWSAIVD